MTNDSRDMNKAFALSALSHLADGIITMQLAAADFERNGRPDRAHEERLFAALEAKRAHDFVLLALPLI